MKYCIVLFLNLLALQLTWHSVVGKTIFKEEVNGEDFDKSDDGKRTKQVSMLGDHEMKRYNVYLAIITVKFHQRRWKRMNVLKRFLHKYLMSGKGVNKVDNRADSHVIKNSYDIATIEPFLLQLLGQNQRKFVENIVRGSAGYPNTKILDHLTIYTDDGSKPIQRIKSYPKALRDSDAKHSLQDNSKTITDNEITVTKKHHRAKRDALPFPYPKPKGGGNNKKPSADYEDGHLSLRVRKGLKVNTATIICTIIGGVIMLALILFVLYFYWNDSQRSLKSFFC
uniref:Cnidarian restricted protein n=1 Tax=Clytia hemisphaerica TaxID=252671 RepID=A0A7M5XFJ8_9CNID|eukprot:TCONS_00033587-protein